VSHSFLPSVRKVPDDIRWRECDQKKKRDNFDLENKMDAKKVHSKRLTVFFDFNDSFAIHGKAHQTRFIWASTPAVEDADQFTLTNDFQL
jgi:hypothetical protein